MDSPDGNRRCKFPKKRKLASPQIPIQDFIRVGFSYKRDQCILRPDVFYARCRFRSSISQNINGAERERAVLKTCPLSSECETPLIPFRTQMRERVRGPIEHFHGIRPKTKMRIGGHDTEHPFLFGQRDNVIGKDRAALLGERRRGCRFARPFPAHESYAAIFESDGAGVQTSDSAQPQQKPENRTQQIS